MIIKDAKKYNFEGAVQKKNKTKRATRNPLVTIDGADDDTQFSIPSKPKRGKKKRPVEGNNSNQKKKKKLNSNLKNSACMDLPITIQSSSGSESIEEAEKSPKALKKKRKRGLSCKPESGPEIPNQGQTTECQEANFLVGKKRRRNVPDTCGGDGGYNTKRKKKKKRKLSCSLILSHAEDDHSKKDLPPTMTTISHEMMLSDRKHALIQNAVSKGESKHICCLVSTDSRGTRNGVLERVTADSTYEVQEENNHKDTAHILKKRKQVKEQKGKKKLKKKKLKEEEGDFVLTSAGNQENHPAETRWKTKSGKKKEKTDLIQNSEGDSKGLKKKKICTRVANSYPDLLEGDEAAFDREGKAAAAARRAKKKAKKSKKERDRAARLESSSFREKSDKLRATTKRKARKSEGAEEEPVSKQAKIKKEAKEREDEIQVVAIKKGNCDEVRIDKLRRQALQEEIDLESGKTKAVKEDEESGHCFGQWGTATFDSAEQKSKFLRLLGGFKKGPASTQEWPAKARQQNMALARHGEEKLQQTLQAEFEKAMDWKQRRGAGLGFQPAPQKWAYIDKHASKSIKFED
uniref:lysine-rich nucleolar protein 1 n=1 Tax=Euleptes europaea TaxID=460621 RepID=UPI00253FA279|nr:lysine-rich nucleolar protein 1 [Euleptes europaea]